MKYDVAIIGGGPAGYTAAERAAFAVGERRRVGFPRFFLRKTHWAGFV